MHFGKSLPSILVLSTVFLLGLNSCGKKDRKNIYFLSPVEGQSVIAGQNLLLKTDAEAGKFDSIRYFFDSKFVASRTDTQAVEYSLTRGRLGGRLLSAIVYSGNDSTEVTTNVQVLPFKAPVKYSYKVINTFPHDTASYTEGLEYHDGLLYESDGEYGQSSLRKADLKTGKVIQKIDIDKRFFAEGITVINNKIIMLTYKEGIGFEYDINTLKELKQFPYTAGREGWGLCFDGKQIYNTDGSNNIYILNKDTYQKEGTIEVYDIKGPVDKLNELEFIDGKIFANIYTEDRIVIIDPQTGAVEGELNLQNIAPYPDRRETGLVLNGIAWDAAGKRLFVTGKKWNKLFEIQLSRAN